jgi:hypothetical protein
MHFIAQEEIVVENGLEQTIFKYYLTNQYSDMYNNILGVNGINTMNNKWMAPDNSDFNNDVIATFTEMNTISFED